MLFGPDYDLKIPALAADRFAVRSQMAMAIDAKADKPYLFGLHQCSRARVWTAGGAAPVSGNWQAPERRHLGSFVLAQPA